MHKVIFAWPPINNPKGYPATGQNRQWQWFKDPTFIYPIVPAQCATMLAKANHIVTWIDAIADEETESEFAQLILGVQPQYIVFEAATPVIDRYIEIINGTKENIPEIKIILCGEHVSARLEEVKKTCKADYFVTGGDWHHKVFEIINGTAWDKKLPIPHIDRNLTRAWLYAYKNGNFKYLPGTYMMSSYDCWYRKCTFCSWAQYHKNYQLRPVEDVLQEVEELITMGFKEIFDDSGTFPGGEWLRTFCQEVVDRGYTEHAAFGCNMRFGALQDKDFEMLGKAGFRMILWGFESANQRTLNRLNKGYDINAVKRDLILAKAAGLESHLTVMFGYPWESYEDAKRTYDMARWLLRKGWASSAQATICIPYPITPLWQECKEQGLLLTEDWSKYDMSQCVMKPGCTEETIKKFQQGIYNIAFHPEFIMRKLLSVRTFDDLKYYLRVGRKVYDRFGGFGEISKASKE